MILFILHSRFLYISLLQNISYIIAIGVGVNEEGEKMSGVGSGGGNRKKDILPNVNID